MATGTVAGNRIYRATIHYYAQQQKMQFGFHVRETGFVNTTEPMAVLDLLRPWIDNTYRPLMINSSRIERIEAIEITSKAYAQQEMTNAVGGASGTESPTHLAYLVSLRSNLRARHRNGRFFLPNVSQGALVGSQITQGAMTALSGAVDALGAIFMGNPVTNAFKLVVVAQARAAAPNRPAIEHSWIDVETMRVANLVSSQYRRKVGVGS